MAWIGISVVRHQQLLIQLYQMCTPRWPRLAFLNDRKPNYVGSNEGFGLWKNPWTWYQQLKLGKNRPYHARIWRDIRLVAVEASGKDEMFNALEVMIPSIRKVYSNSPTVIGFVPVSFRNFTWGPNVEFHCLGVVFQPPSKLVKSVIRGTLET